MKSIILAFFILLVIYSTEARRKSSRSSNSVRVKPLDSKKRLVVTKIKNCNLVRLMKLDRNQKFPKKVMRYKLRQNDLVQKSFSLQDAYKSVQNSKKQEKNQLLNLIAKAEKVSGCKRNKRHYRLKTKTQAPGWYVQTVRAKYPFHVSDDRTHQYFDYGKQINQWDIHAQLRSTGEHGINRFINPFGDFKLGRDEEWVVESVSLLKRFSGTLPTDQVREEMRLSHEDFTRHTPKTSDAFWYFVYGSVPEKGNRFDVYHEVMEMCCKRLDSQGEYRRLMIDRGSHEGIIDTWQTRVRFVDLGPTTNCDIHDTENTFWLEHEEKGNVFVVKDPLTQIPGKKEVLHIPFRKITGFALRYIMKFPVYNTLINCQHFATNLFNLMTGSSFDYEAAEMMNDHADLSHNMRSCDHCIPAGIALEEFVPPLPKLPIPSRKNPHVSGARKKLRHQRH